MKTLLLIIGLLIFTSCEKTIEVEKKDYRCDISTRIFYSPHKNAIMDTTINMQITLYNVSVDSMNNFESYYNNYFALPLFELSNDFIVIEQKTICYDTK
jgi:hypothetical protein